MAVTRSQTKVEGFKDLQKALEALPTATKRNTVRRVFKKVLEPMYQAAVARAPKLTGRLAESIVITTKRHRGVKKKNEVETYLSTEGAPHAHLQEFGTVNMAANPFLRPAWDQYRDPTLDEIQDEMWIEIDKSVERLARKAKRDAAKMKAGK